MGTPKVNIPIQGVKDMVTPGTLRPATHRTVTEAKGADSSFWFVLYTELRSKAKHFEIKSPGVLNNFNKSLKRMIQSLPLMET